MVEIVQELKAQLGETGATFEALRPEIVALGDQKSAFEKVIEVYDPGFELAAPAKARRASRVAESRSGTELLKGRPVATAKHILTNVSV
ncbi:hypothetical protein [Agrobacterium sp. B1(2019)]|uniref:hypothetical protein n=1 Tax=Agrobacterium sp. B1(2019) TaxID=2607032 RepID=UPI0011EBC9F9|nr:hypothetical protein [Agrobacterium sp. B1(2019)]TZG36571.1 hypothetical protein AGR1_03470 [Agrobacterium sp. B1(2019)]